MRLYNVEIETIGRKGTLYRNMQTCKDILGSIDLNRHDLVRKCLEKLSVDNAFLYQQRNVTYIINRIE